MRLRHLAGILTEEEVEQPLLTTIAVRHEDDEHSEDREIETFKGELGQIEKELYIIFARLNGFIEKVSGRIKEEQLENECKHVQMYRDLQRTAYHAAEGIESTCRALKGSLTSPVPY